MIRTVAERPGDPPQAARPAEIASTATNEPKRMNFPRPLPVVDERWPTTISPACASTCDLAGGVNSSVSRQASSRIRPVNPAGATATRAADALPSAPLTGERHVL